ncbi:MAG TPA: hypothetical protein VJ032_13070 [Thermoanaerobaculia bacterium]|nr:hypothetical protein [Thermoanaerobaculia bacterium]
MFKSILVLSLLATPLAAADAPSPAYYLKMLSESKLIYGIADGPVKNSVEVLSCPAASDQKRAASSDTMSPKGHFAAANAHAEAGRLNEAREELVKALVGDPSFGAALTALEKQPEAYGVNALVSHPFNPPSGLVGNKKGDMVELSAGDGGWLGYSLCKAVWMYEPDFRKLHGGAKKNEWSVNEESACITNAVVTEMNSTRKKLEDNGGKPKDADVVAALPDSLRFIREVSDKNLLDGYVLFEVLGQHCPDAIASLDDASRAELERYIRAYVVVPRAADSH